MIVIYGYSWPMFLGNTVESALQLMERYFTEILNFEAILSVKMNVKSLKNILIVNRNFVVTIGLHIATYLLKLFLE